MSSALRHLEAELAELAERGLLRRCDGPPPADLLNLCSNDYLGYAREPWPEGLVAAGGAGASRLVFGEHEAHARAERALADWVGAESALLFSSGYAANVGVLSCLAGEGDVIFSDRLNHASIIDGCRLSGAKTVVVPHCDAAALDDALRSARSARRRWVVTESYFSMDGDIPDLATLRAVCDAHDAALVVDEAHAVGVFGPEGAGLLARAGVRADVVVGAFGKALGLQGAFAAGPLLLRHWLWNRARSFVFSTGVSPQLAAAVEARVARCRADEPSRERLARASAALREALRDVGVEDTSREGPVVPWTVGEPRAALELAAGLRARGVLVQAIRPPTVPAGTSRLRLTARADLTTADLARATEALRGVVAGARG